ncbi:expressed unknown protein [Seminavis robusta]|uniref:Uncharacterized protein n=1 Tax=Seminavis robusta TaxID=568900 RepID=A0A9N8H116_9STRA|nr:expressed unknown protein [Seminavis robusta]|eukprot:Sro9_g007470.1 n/a (272) ;mRNA; f:156995-157810
MNVFLRFLPVMAIIVSRLVQVGFAIVAAFSIPEVRQLLNTNYERVGDTFYVPIKVCKPTEITLNGTTITLDPDTGNDCHSLGFLVNACAMSFLFAIVAVGVFVVSDLFARRAKGSSATVVGMGLFLIFILLQAAACTWALFSESLFWIDYFDDDILEEHFEELGIEKVDTHGNSWMLMATGGAAVLSAALLLLESLCSLCCCGKGNAKEEAAGSVEETTTRKNNTSELPIVAPPSFTERTAGSDDPPHPGTAAEEESKNEQPTWTSWAKPF